MRDHRDCYAVLGVSPDTEWAGLRAQYRRLISQWHPDRFAANADERRLAEERSKQITAAYQELERYYRAHGALPPLSPLEATRVHASPRERDARPVPEEAAVGAGPATGGQRAIVRGRPRRWRRAALVGALFVVVLYASRGHFGGVVPDRGSSANTIVEQALPQAPPGPAQVPRPERVISIGSTLGDVFAIQGIPTRTQGEHWHYGKSEIRFSHGKVVSWVEDPDHPLRIARNLPVQPKEGIFQIGSSKDDVRATQGAPVTESGTVWDYGLSRVYFEDNRVVRWEESPMQPLRVPR